MKQRKRFVDHRYSKLLRFLAGYLVEATQTDSVLTLTRCRSIGFMMEPWKNSTVVKCRLNSPSSSRSGGFLVAFTTDNSQITEQIATHP